ncbi:lysophosphatidic acid receptor 6-like [Pempheris klunzingeri]|uniref:lysophosphatidic acid receptor 6-like n=1 Tax=Pempheris klunzingeri TaxID=3127111 RepID=UPI003980C20D
MNSTMEDELQPQLVYALVFGFILVLGLPLNAVSLWILLRRHSLKSPSAVFMVNLAISDLLLVISLPMRVYFYATGTWPLGATACACITVLFYSNIRSSTIFITTICVDRLLAVVYPLRSRHLRTSSNAWKAAALVWLFVVVVSIPWSVKLTRFLRGNNESTCFAFIRRDPNRSSMAYFQFVLVFTMLVVNIVCTALVSWTLRTHLSDSARVSNK